jgi:hypothetical protein
MGAQSTTLIWTTVFLAAFALGAFYWLLID